MSKLRKKALSAHGGTLVSNFRCSSVFWEVPCASFLHTPAVIQNVKIEQRKTALSTAKLTEAILHSSCAIPGPTSPTAQRRHWHVLGWMEFDGRGKGTQEVLRVMDGVDVNTFPGSES